MTPHDHDHEQAEDGATYFLSTVREYISSASASPERNFEDEWESSSATTFVDEEEVEDMATWEGLEPWDEDVDEMPDLVEADSHGVSLGLHGVMGLVDVDMSSVETLDLTASEEDVSSQETQVARTETTKSWNGSFDTLPVGIQAESESEKPAEASDSDIEIVQPRPRSSSAAPKKPSLSAQLTSTTPIAIPQVLGKRARSDPSLIDPFIATPALTELLEAGTHPEDVLWACFLKNNTFALDHSAASENMQVWLNAHPERYKNIASLVFVDFLNHPVEWSGKTHKRRRVIYRPIRLMAKCPNLQTVELRFDVKRLPGFVSAWSDLHLQMMNALLNEKYHIADLLTKTSKSLRKIRFVIGMHSLLWKSMSLENVQLWKNQFTQCIWHAALGQGRSADELSGVALSCCFSVYGVNGYF